MGIINPGYHALTIKFNGIANQIVIECGISLPFDPNINKDEKAPKVSKSTALWDTGATASVITQKTAAALGLKPVSKTMVSHAGGESTQSVYLVNIYLPNSVVIPNVKVTECQDTSGTFGVIIGMDIIALGDFAVTNFNGITTASFRIPSIATTDYVKEFNDKHRTPAVAEKLPGRNEPCHCGSGKKFKHCHGSHTAK
ncbi:MAG: SEC-C domain-containing protein [Bacteroidetes bacterium]|nr:SEC-C domain-containing protein [Bacteroidota bacterium]